MSAIQFDTTDDIISRIDRTLERLTGRQLVEAQLFRKAVDDENFRVFLRYRSRFVVVSWTRSLCLCVSSKQESQRVYDHVRGVIEAKKKTVSA